MVAVAVFDRGQAAVAVEDAVDSEADGKRVATGANRSRRPLERREPNREPNHPSNVRSPKVSRILRAPADAKISRVRCG